MAAVTAFVLLPIQGGMTAPNPPAGPPAATTKRWSGVNFFGAIAHDCRLADIGPFFSANVRSLEQELGDVMRQRRLALADENPCCRVLTIDADDTVANTRGVDFLF